MEKRDGNWLSSGKGVCSRTGEEKLKNGMEKFDFTSVCSNGMEKLDFTLVAGRASGRRRIS